MAGDPDGLALPADVCYQAAKQAKEEGDLPSAVAAARAALRQDRTYSGAQFLLAQLLAQVGRSDEARGELFALLTAGRLSVEGARLLGQILASAGERALAEEFLRARTGSGPIPVEPVVRPAAHAAAQDVLGRAGRYLQLGQPARAARILKQAGPDSRGPRWQRLLARASFAAGDFADAAGQAAALLEKEPEDTDMLAVLADSLGQQGSESAGEVLDRLDAAPAGSPAREQRRAAALGRAGRHEDAYRHVRRSRRQAGLQADGLFVEAAAAYNTGRYAEALALFSDLRRIDAQPLVADHFVEQIQSAQPPGRPRRLLPYDPELPPDVVNGWMAEVRRQLRGGLEEAYSAWHERGLFQDVLLWVAVHGTEQYCREACLIIASFADAQADAALRSVLLRRDLPDAGKQEVAALLERIGSPPPYAAFVAGETVFVQPATENLAGAAGRPPAGSRTDSRS